MLPPGSVYAVLGGLAAAENVFPPIPADTIIGVGAFLCHYGQLAPQAVFGVVWISNVAGAVSVYTAGRTVGRQFFTGRVGRRLLNPARLERLEALYRRHGTWGIFLSRFLPGVRAVVPPFAGVARVPVMRAVLPMALASGLWYGAITLAVVTFAGSIEEVVAFVDRSNQVALVVVAALVIAAFVALLRRRAR
ncbi:MAG TPA: DedA family protein [Gemmatimonadales bacterium]|jgi:membrane protein DedA with SNARE-associated domain